MLKDLPGPSGDAIALVQARDWTLTKPPGALGRLEAIVEWLAAWQGTGTPKLDRVRAHVFAGNHGVTAKGVSAYPAAVTAQMVANFETGGAAINQLCWENQIELGVTALDLEHPTADMTEAPAMTTDAFLAAFSTGFRIGMEPADLLILGEMGIGNTFAAAAICQGLLGGDGTDWTGRGTGLDDVRLAEKAALVSRAVHRHGGAPLSGLDALISLGGRELAAIAGAALGARLAGVPLLLDGYVVGAACLPLVLEAPAALDHAMAAHVSAEPGHRRLLTHFNMTPLLDLGMRLGEGSGAALAVGLIRSALACHTGMASFEGAGVSGPR